jgi:hypothetical protein
MAYDDRTGRFPERGRWRGEHMRDDGPATQWRGDPSFGAGWGNQQPQAERFGDRGWRQPDDPWGDADRFRGAGDFGPVGSDLEHGGPGYDAGLRTGTASYDVHRASRGHGSDIGTRFDPHYSEWRSRQIAALDRDYEEYRRETQSRFDREFGTWRERRGAQREAIGKVAAHMEVVGSNGAHVGTVDATGDEHIVLTRSDPAAGGIHHRIPCGWIDRVEDKVILNLTGEEATTRWREESRSRALFERPNSGSPGPHALNRSFAGTYPDEE